MLYDYYDGIETKLMHIYKVESGCVWPGCVPVTASGDTHVHTHTNIKQAAGFMSCLIILVIVIPCLLPMIM